MMKRVCSAWILLTTIVLVGCAPRGSDRARDLGAVGGPPVDAPAAGVAEVDWTDPFGPVGVELESSNDAAVSFQHKDPPASLGQVLAIYESNPQKVEKGARELVWVIQSESTTFNLEEKRTDLTQEQFEDAAVCHAEEVGCDTTGWSL